MLPSSAIQVIRQSQDQLEIIDPPRYGAAWGTIIIAVVLLWLFMVKRRPSVPISWLAIAIPIIMVVGSIALLGSRTRITLKRSSGILLIEREFFGRSSSGEQIPLTDIRNAIVESRSGPRRKIIVVLRTGGLIPLGSFSGQEGHYAAANAINDFLGVKGQQ